MPLGQKLVKSINNLGQKANHSVAVLGRKTNNTLNKIDKGINRVDNIAGNVIDQTANVAQNVVQKSGQITNGLRAGSNIANAIASNLDSLGVPGGSLAHSATRQLANGATSLDNKRDKLANRSE